MNDTPTTPGQPQPASTPSSKWPTRVAAIALVAGIAALTWWWASSGKDKDGGQQQAARPDIILISIDTLRADHLGCYGYAQAKTPVLDQLAKEGVRFENCFTPYPLTLPAHTSMLSGTSPIYHRVRDNTYHRVPETGFAMLQTEAGTNGYATGAFVSAGTMARETGILRGFDVADDFLTGDKHLDDGLLVSDRKAEDTLAKARAWLEHKRGSPVFCFVHLFDPHFPYTPPREFGAGLRRPDEFTGETMRPGYDAEIAYADWALGEFFKYLKQAGRYDDALIIVTADHGEGFGERGELTHGYFIYDQTTHVPLIVKLPKAQAKAANTGISVPGIVQTTDLMPTIAARAGMKLSDAAQRQQQGNDLSAMLSGEVKDAGYTAYIESHYGYFNAGWARLRGVRRLDSFSVVTEPREFYRAPDWGRDLLAQVALPDAVRDERFAQDRSLVSERLAKWFAPGVQSLMRSPGEKTPEHRAGAGPGETYYYSGGMPYPGEGFNTAQTVAETLADDEGRPSPHQRKEQLQLFEQGELNFSQGYYKLALDKFNAVLASDPASIQALRLAIRTSEAIAFEQAANESESRKRITAAADYAAKASAAAKAVKLDAYAIDLKATELRYRLMLGDAASVRDALNGLLREHAADGVDGAALPVPLRVKLVKLQALAAYQAVEGTDAQTKRAEIGARVEQELRRIDPVSADSARREIEAMKRGERLRSAPWDR